MRNPQSTIPKKAFKLPIQTAVIVPSTNFDKRAKNSTFRRRVAQTRYELSKMFGGYTSVSSYGGFYSDKKRKMVNERGVVVYAYATKPVWKDKNDDWYRWLRRKKKSWKQESIGAIVENDMFYI